MKVRFIKPNIKRLLDIKKKYSNFKDQLDESAIPAYTHWNPLARFVFIKRIYKILSLLDLCPKGTVLDFGCGSGLLLPTLAENFKEVYGVDINTSFAEYYLKSEGYFDKIHLIKSDNVKHFSDNSVDVIIAADVLEHVENLKELLSDFSRILKRGGCLIISGPTENFVYKLGRKIVGFSGEYHVRNIDKIIESASKVFRLVSCKKVWFVATLFKVCKLTKV